MFVRHNFFFSLFKKAKSLQKMFHELYAKKKNLSQAYFQIRKILHFCDGITLSPEYRAFYQHHEMIWNDFNLRMDNQFRGLEQYIESVFFLRTVAEYSFSSTIANIFEKNEKYLYSEAPKDFFRHSI